MTSLFDPLDLAAGHGARLQNRVTMAALTRQRAGEDGIPTALHAEYYAQRASAGLVLTEGTFPAFSCRSFPGQAGIADQEHQEGWQQVAQAVHARGGILFMQVMHGGRTSHPDLLRGAEPEGPSAVATGGPVRGFSGKTEGLAPRVLGTEEMPRIVGEFVAAARRAVDAGVDGIEIHGANGYLLHEFMSPVSNLRTDQYGGSPQNRARLMTEVVRAVAEEIGPERTALRISPEHNIQGVLEEDHEDVLATYGALLEGIKGLGLAYLSVLHRDIDGEFVAWLREGFGGTFFLNSGFGSVTDLAEARHVVEDGLADAAAVGRELIANPDLVRRWQEGRELNAPDPTTFYTAGPEGYTDYPFVD